MLLSNEQLRELIQKSRRAETTEKEESQLLEWLNADPKNIAMLLSGIDLKELIRKWAEYEKMDTDEAEEKCWARWLQERNEIKAGDDKMFGNPIVYQDPDNPMERRRQRMVYQVL
jgi:hypothetical protein